MSEVQKGHKRIRLLRNIHLGGGVDGEKGAVHDVPAAMAQHIVGAESAEYVDPQEAPTSVNRMASPSNADPSTSKVSDAPAPKVKGGGK